MARPASAPTPDQILSQRDRILGSDVFSGSQRICDFLDYLIAESLGDRAPRLKEFAIGIAVFGRDESFDPRIDSVVRVEAGRLRAKLTQYYAEVGAADPVRISVPKGGYVPRFDFGPSVTGGDRAIGARGAGSNARKIALALAAALTAIALFLALSREVPGPAAAPEFRKIAVLPLRDWSDVAEDYFSEAMTDVLIARLSQSRDLRVTSMSSVMAYRNADLQPSEIAAQLGVDVIVEGAVYRDSDYVRITASLIDPAAERNLWSSTFERPMVDVLSLQNEIASEIAARLLGEIVPAVKRADRTVDPEAYESYLKGIYWRNRLTPQGFNRGIQYFQQAIDRQPDYAEAYASMAACHCRLAGHGIEVVKPEIALPFAADLAIKALDLDETLAEPNAVLGIIKFKFEWDARESVRLLRRALELNPSLFEAQLWYSQVSEGIGDYQLAVEMAQSAYRINPLSLAANLNLGWQLYQVGDLAGAETQFDKLIQFDPEFWGGHWGKGYVYRAREMHEDAIREFARAVELEGGHTLPMASLGYTHAIAGRREEALAIVTDLRAMAESNYVSPVHMAMIYAGLDDTESALDWLDEAYEVRARSLAWLTARHEFDRLSDNPRYQALVAAVGIAAN